MSTRGLILKAVLAATFFLSLSASTMAQSILVQAIAPSDESPRWTIEVAFSTTTAPDKIKQVFLINVEGARIIGLRNFGPDSPGSSIYTATPESPLKIVIDPQSGKPKFKDHYEFQAVVENDQGELVPLRAPVVLLDKKLAANKEAR